MTLSDLRPHHLGRLPRLAGTLWGLAAACGSLCPIAWGQAVQLPTWRVFAVDSSVLVPDQGTAVLGGVNYARDGAIRRGVPLLPGPPFGVTARSGVRGTGMASVSATIIDHREWDEALLNQARAARGAPAAPDPVLAEAAWLSRHVHATAADPEGRHALDELRRQADAQTARHHAQQQAEVRALIGHGDACFARQDYGAARLFYRNALRQSQGELRRQAETRLSRVRVAQQQASSRAAR